MSEDSEPCLARFSPETKLPHLELDIRPPSLRTTKGLVGGGRSVAYENCCDRGNDERRSVAAMVLWKSPAGLDQAVFSFSAPMSTAAKRSKVHRRRPRVELEEAGIPVCRRILWRPWRDVRSAAGLPDDYPRRRARRSCFHTLKGLKDSLVPSR